MAIYISIAILFIAILLVSGIADYYIKMQKQNADQTTTANKRKSFSEMTQQRPRKTPRQEPKKKFNIDDDDAFARYESTEIQDANEKTFWDEYDFDLDDYLEKEKKKRNR